MKIEKPEKLHSKMLGGKTIKEEIAFGISELDATISKISSVKRRHEVTTFYRDYKKSISNIGKTLKRDGIVCFVVANRTVGGMILPTDIITEEILKEEGFHLIEKFERKIRRKRMPSKNSPSNKKGNKQSTMSKEYIIIMKKA